MSQEIIEGIQTIEKEKGIEEGILITALEDALRAAYKKTPGATRHAEVKLDGDGEFRVYGIEIPEDIEVRLVDEAREARIAELEQIEEETGERQHTLVTDDDLELDWSQVPPDKIVRTDVTPDNFGRIAAQTAKQVIQQRIREAERAIMYEEYVDRQGEVVTGIVQQAGDRNNVLVDLGRVEALLPRSEQVDGERYEQGSRIKAVIAEVRSGTKGPQVILSAATPSSSARSSSSRCPRSRTDWSRSVASPASPGIARRSRSSRTCRESIPSVRASVRADRASAWSSPSCAARRSTSSLEHRAGPLRARALSPARVREVYIDDETREATVIVPNDQLALAIGKEGLNARLATRLTGWKIDIQSEAEFAQAEADAAYAGAEDDEEYSGRCAAVLSNGKRCPNASLPGSRYCGVPAHQALTATDAAEPREEALVEAAVPVVAVAVEDAEPEVISEALEVADEPSDALEEGGGEEV